MKQGDGHVDVTFSAEVLYRIDALRERTGWSRQRVVRALVDLGLDEPWLLSGDGGGGEGGAADGVGAQRFAGADALDGGEFAGEVDPPASE